jgi:hypothetical protein
MIILVEYNKNTKKINIDSYALLNTLLVFALNEFGIKASEVDNYELYSAFDTVFDLHATLKESYLEDNSIVIMKDKSND